MTDSNAPSANFNTQDLEIFWEMLSDGYPKLANFFQGVVWIDPETGELEAHYARLKDTAHLIALCRDGALRGKHVYAEMGLLGRRPGSRATVDAVVAARHYWAEADIASEGHAIEGAATSVEEVLQFLADEVPHKPTMILHSGGGLQMHWMFENPQVIARENEFVSGDILEARRNAIANNHYRFEDALQTAASRRGFDMCSVGDLARFMRVPGTLNVKPEYGKGKMARVLSYDPEALYNPADFVTFINSVPEPEAGVLGAVALPGSMDGDIELSEEAAEQVIEVLMENMPGRGKNHYLNVPLCGYLRGYHGQRLSFKDAFYVMDEAYKRVEDPHYNPAWLIGNLRSTDKRIAGGRRVWGGPEMDKVVPGLAAKIGVILGFDRQREDALWFAEKVESAEDVVANVERFKWLNDKDFERVLNTLSGRFGDALDLNVIRTIKRPKSESAPGGYEEVTVTASPTENGQAQKVIVLRQDTKTDYANAERLAKRIRGSYVYLYEAKSWYVFTGKRWEPDKEGTILRRAAETARSILHEAAEEPDKDERKALIKWATTSESHNRLEAMVKFARTIDGMTISGAVFDQDPYILVCNNGTVDLRTGRLRESRPEDWATMLSPHDFPGLEAPMPERFMRFLDEIFPDYPELPDYLQLALGYGTTGLSNARAFFIPHGTGRNGKGTLLETISAVLGDYAHVAKPETFLVARREGGQASSDVADLKGRRLVISSESRPGAKMDANLIKSLTGDDTINARHLYERAMEFKPTWTVFLATNHRPEMPGDDVALWERVKLLPFDVRISDEKKDTELKDKLAAEGSGILAWLVRGAKRYIEGGLIDPESVQMATAEYQMDSDPVGTFIQRCLIVNPDDESLYCEPLDLAHAWSAFCEEEDLDITTMKYKRITQRLKGEYGKTRIVSKAKKIGRETKRVWIGFRLNDEDEDAFKDRGESISGCMVA